MFFVRAEDVAGARQEGCAKDVFDACLPAERLQSHSRLWKVALALVHQRARLVDMRRYAHFSAIFAHFSCQRCSDTTSRRIGSVNEPRSSADLFAERVQAHWAELF